MSESEYGAVIVSHEHQALTAERRPALPPLEGCALTPHHSANDLLIRKLDSTCVLSDSDKAALLRLPMQITEVRADQDLVREGDRPSRSCMVVTGYTCVFKMTGEGKRQISAFQVPGDIPDLQSLFLDVLDSSLATITPCTVAFIRHEALREMCRMNFGVAEALWRTTLIDGSVFREWVTNVGRREAYSRIAHVFCETLTRMRAVGLAENGSCDLPMTQSELADATGISTVHVNRTIQELRADKLIELKGAKLNVLDWDALTKAADFDPTYLHLRQG
jgi:CRP-like cAMP-binding protein